MESSGYYLIDPDFNVLHINETTKKLYPGLELGKKCYTCLMGLDAPCGPCPVVHKIKGPRIYTDPIRQISESVDAIDVPIEGKGLCHALVFSTVGENAELSASLPTTTEELINLALIKSLTIDFSDVFSVNITNEHVMVYRHDGKAVDGNLPESQFQYSELSVGYIEKFVHPDDREMMRKKTDMGYILSRLHETETLTIHYRVIYQDSIHYFLQKIARIGEAGSFENFIVGTICEDEEVENRIKEQALQHSLNLMQYDSMTGLFTKDAFMKRCEVILSENPDTEYDLCIFRLENLGLLNHQYGYLSGEKIVGLIGRLLQAYWNDTNCIAYIGDGSFISLTVNTEDAIRKANIMDFRNDIFTQSEIKSLSTKWSIYKNIDRSRPIAELFEKTMFALSTIRSNIHEDYAEFDHSVFERMEYETGLEKAFDEALASGEFICYYQPKYSSRSQKIIGAEALVRWRKKDESLISPADFIPVLERCGKINQLDAYVFRKTCEFQKKLKKLGIDSLPISVNLSRASIFTEGLISQYVRAASENDVEPKLIPIEITESAAVRAHAIQVFAKDFRDAGFVLHMDDFGAGYSSLSSLNVIPFECIKLDKSLIDYIGSSVSESLLKHIVAYAHEQGMTVVAEGVETYEQYLFLKIIGCDYIQGYYYSKPVEEEAFLEMLKN